VKAIIFLPTQGPHLPRGGPAEQFDWRVQCRLAAERWRGNAECVVYVPSAFRESGSRAELEYYSGQLLAEGVPPEGMILDPRGLETVEQCELALALSEKERARLVAVTCRAQSRRVRYLLRGHDVEHITAEGTANPWLRFTNILLGVAFPIVDRLGLRGWWKRRVGRRRILGKQ
jgi:hypothetical protein